MGNLASALDELQAEDLGMLTAPEVEARLSELYRGNQRLSAEILRTVSECERRRAHYRRGMIDATQALSSGLGISGREAGSLLARAKSLEGMPLVSAAHASGEINQSKVSLLASALKASPERFGQEEESLLEAAITLDPADFTRRIAYWRQGADREGALREERWRYERRGLELSETPEQMTSLEGRLDPEGGEILRTALYSILDCEAREMGAEADSRSPTQKRADALVELCRHYLDSKDRPEVGGERPHLLVLVSWESLRGAPGLSQLDRSGAVITPAAARRLACDAQISRVITGPDSLPLEVGRASRTVTPAQRRALLVRDRHCRFPGCRRPHQWCDAHHYRQSWIEGGETNLSDLILLCRFHHRLVEEANYRIEGEVDSLILIAPDGTVLTDRAPP